MFSPADGDRKPALTPIADLPQGEGSPRPFVFSRIVWVSGAIVVFVFLNATLLGYLPFIERRPAPPLRPLGHATQPLNPPLAQAPITPAVIAAAPGPAPSPLPSAALEPAPGPQATATTADPPVSAPRTAPLAPPARPVAPALSAQTQAPAAVALAPVTPNPVKRAALPPAPAPQPRAAAVAKAPILGPVSAPARAAPLAAARAPASPAALGAPTPSPTKTPQVASATPALSGETFAVQVGAFKTDGLAAGAIERAIAAGPAGGAALAGRREPVQKDGDTLYRALVSGFTTPKDAARFCATLKTAGMACFIKR